MQAFSIDRSRLDTITTLDPAFQDIIGRASTFSFEDIQIINQLYPCMFLISTQYLTYIYRSNLHISSLHRSNLHISNLHRSIPHSTNLHRANLYRSNLHRSNLHRSRVYIDLVCIDLTSTYIQLMYKDLHSSVYSRIFISTSFVASYLLGRHIFF